MAARRARSPASGLRLAGRRHGGAYGPPLASPRRSARSRRSGSPPLAIVAEESVLRPRVRMEVVRDIPHVSVDPELAELGRGDLGQTLTHVRDVVGRRRGAVVAPDDHGCLADLALGDPADVVLPEPRRELQRLAQVAVVHAKKLGTTRRLAHGLTLPHCSRMRAGAARSPIPATTSATASSQNTRS